MCWGSAILLCYFLAQWFCRRENKNPDRMADLMIYVFSAALIGARLAQAVFYQPEKFLENPLDIFKVWEGGLASHGGVVGVFIGMWIFSKRFPEYGYLWLMERTAIASIIAGVLIRIGNLMNSELIGKATDISWAFVFVQVDEIPRHPTVLYESIAYFLIFVFQLFLYRKLKNSLPGIYLSVFFTLIFSTRILLEFTKEPEATGIAGLSNTQTLSLPLIVVGLLMFVLTFSRKLKNNQ